MTDAMEAPAESRSKQCQAALSMRCSVLVGALGPRVPRASESSDLWHLTRHKERQASQGDSALKGTC